MFNPFSTESLLSWKTRNEEKANLAGNLICVHARAQWCNHKSQVVRRKNLTISASVTTWFNSFAGRGLFARNMIYWCNSGHNCESPAASCRLSVAAALWIDVEASWSFSPASNRHKKSPNVAWSWFELKAGCTGTRVRNFDTVMDDTVGAGWRVYICVCVVTWPKSIGQQQQLLAIVLGNWGE